MAPERPIRSYQLMLMRRDRDPSVRRAATELVDARRSLRRAQGVVELRQSMIDEELRRQDVGPPLQPRDHGRTYPAGWFDEDRARRDAARRPQPAQPAAPPVHLVQRLRQAMASRDVAADGVRAAEDNLRRILTAVRPPR